MPNPLLNPGPTPNFSDIIPELHIESALQEILADNRHQLHQLCEQLTFTWDNLMVPLENMTDRVHKMWSTVKYLKDVRETDALREAYKRSEPLLDAYDADYYQNARLYAAIKQLADSAEFATLSAAQQRVITNQIRDFRLAGAGLPDDKKQRLKDVKLELSRAETQFGENVQDDTDSWTLHLTSRDALEGLPDDIIEAALQEARQRHLEGWVLTLRDDVFYAVMEHARQRDLRRQFFYAHATLASDLSHNKDKYDNTPVLERILALRHEKANLLGFPNFSEYVLATNAAKTPQRVLDFLHRLATESRPTAKKEFADVVALAAKDGITDFKRWDLLFYSQRLREQRYQYSAAEIKPYFPLDKVLKGYFEILHILYGITIESATPPDTWHPDVRYYHVYDENKTFRGGVFVDFFARANKLGGCWANDCRTRRKLADGTIQYPISHLLTNFTPPVEGKPCLLTEDQVLGLFHEFGHCLHNVMTTMDYRSIAGMSGIPTDGIEFPSQFMEYFCFKQEILQRISGHYETGECLPAHLMQRIITAARFQSAMIMIRQIEYSLFDFRLHHEYDPAKGMRMDTILNEIQDTVAVVPTPADANRMGHSFTHLFASGYGSAYYSYKWSEVLSCDAFLRFEEEGLLSERVGRDFLHLILEQGGLPELMDAFVKFRGREPRVEALLYYTGLTSLPSLSQAGKMTAPLFFKPDTRVDEEKIPEATATLQLQS